MSDLRVNYLKNKGYKELKRIVFWLQLLGCGLCLISASAEELTNQGILMVVAGNGFRDEELLVPERIFQDAGLQVVVASSRLTAASGMLGAQVKPDLLLSQVQLTD